MLLSLLSCCGVYSLRFLVQKVVVVWDLQGFGIRLVWVSKVLKSGGVHGLRFYGRLLF